MPGPVVEFDVVSASDPADRETPDSLEEVHPLMRPPAYAEDVPVPGARTKVAKSRPKPVKRQTGAPQAAADIWAAFRNFSLCARLALLDVRNRYRQTVLGPFWNVLSIAVLIISLGFVYALLWKIDYRQYLPYFSAGYLTWVLITSSMNESAQAFITGANLIKYMSLPMTLHINRLILRNLIVFAHALNVHIAALVLLQYPINPLALFLVPLGLILVSANMLWIGLCLAALCARYRDVVQVVTSLLQIAFFTTPIFWTPDLLEPSPVAYFILVTANPFYHLVDVVRAPLLGGFPTLLTYGITGGGIVVGFLLALFVFGRARGRIAYWI